MYDRGIEMYASNGVILEDWNTHIIDTTNRLNNKPIYYWKDTTGVPIPLDAAQVILANCSNFNIVNLNLTGSGIQLGFSNGNIINNNHVSNTWNSIYLHQSDNNIISNNTVIYNGIGIELRFSEYNRLFLGP